MSKFEVGDIGEHTAYEDGYVRRTREKIKKTEQKLLNDYNNLNNFKSNNYEEFLPYINDELNKRKVFLHHKKTSLENQNIALLKILEHLLTVESKNKEFEVYKILSQINLVEEELKEYSKIL